jgi:starvation-inducible DNA-binding protein
MNPTNNEVPEKKKHAAVVELLGARLADALELKNRTKRVHCCVQSPSFFALHELFEKANEGVEEYVDLVADRLAQLGEDPDRDAPRATVREELPVVTGRENVDAVATALATFRERVRASVDVSDKAGDAATADLFSEISRGVDNWLWFVESHLHREW